ncbi:MAG TPA: helix-turn-helix domain-containing protein [Phenylobacterium sp.]|jgi:DNA-binding transcriptional ArsR family regulator|nr:helix-turn-helix domain-containing protein [Phenylobacterium sp.]
MEPSAPPYVVRTKKQLSALASSARQEIVDVLANAGAISVAELASALGRHADALYYHLKVLRQAGLVLSAGHRGRGKHREELIRSVSADLRLPYELGEGGNRGEISAIVASMLRLGIRDFDHAFAFGDVKVSGADRELLALRKIGWLTPDEVGDVNRSIAELAQIAAGPPGRGRLYAITILLTPLDHRAHPGGKAARAARKAKPP